jgi:hypothetical protein
LDQVYKSFSLFNYEMVDKILNDMGNVSTIFVVEGDDYKTHIVKLIATFLPNELQMVSSSLSTFLALN